MIIVTNLNLKRAGVESGNGKKRRRQSSEADVHNFVHLVKALFRPNPFLTYVGKLQMAKKIIAFVDAYSPFKKK